jgi:hypothetical protein
VVLQYGVTVYRKTLLAHRFMSSPDIDEPTSTLVLILKMDSLHVIFEEVPNGTYHLVFTCAHMLLHLLPCHDQAIFILLCCDRSLTQMSLIPIDSQDSNPEGPKDFNGIFHNEMRLL